MSMWIISRGGVLLILLGLGYRVLIDLILHRSSINNSARLSNKFGGFYFIFKFGISGLLHQVITAIADRIRGCQEGNGSFGFQDLCFRQELLEYMDVHDNDASESSQPSWVKISKLEYKFQDQENSEDIFSFGSALYDFICVVFILDRNIILGKIQIMLQSPKVQVTDAAIQSHLVLTRRQVGAIIFQAPMTSADIKTRKVSHQKMLLLDKATSALDSRSACIV
ncbi:hypothetical protein Tco_1192559 [Tanacetum coccineum]